MRVGDLVVVLATEERGQIVEIARDGRLHVRIDWPGPGAIEAIFDAHELEFVGSP